ncbi:MAG: tetratricopeptide repeat protein [Planktomarina sp.]
MEAQLKRAGNRIGGDRLNHAIALVHRFDYSEAEDIFLEIKADHALAVQESARASYGLGDIAAASLKWHDAAAHYVEAAKLHDCLDHNAKAGEYLYRTGKYKDAEPFIRTALQQAKAEYGKDHADYGLHLNNLAELLRTTGQYEEAEPMYREAVDVLERALGAEHPNTQKVKANLAAFLAERGE